MTIRQLAIATLTLLAVAAAPLAAVARAPQAASDNAATSETERANAAVVESLYRAFATGDGPGIAAVLGDNIVWTEAESGPYADHNPYVGPGAVFEGVFGRIGQQWQGFAATPATVLPSGDRVVVLGRYTGTNIATGEPLDAQFAHIFTVSGGKIVAFQQYTDTARWVGATTPD